jgi:hypothetical protein
MLRYQVDMARRVVEMNCGDIDVGNQDVGLCYDGKDRTWRAIWIVVSLIIYYYSRSNCLWNGRH